MWLYTSLYLTLPWFYFTLLCSTSLYNGSTSLYLYTLSLLSFIFLDSIHHFIWLYLLLAWLYCTLVDCTSLYHGSTSLYFTQRGYTSLYSTLLHSTMALLDSTVATFTLQVLPWLWSTLHDYFTPPRLYFIIPDSTLLYHGSTLLYIPVHVTLPYSTMPLLLSASLYCGQCFFQDL